MIINSSKVNMSAKTKETKSLKTTRETLSTNLLTGEKNYSKESFSSTYEKSCGNAMGEPILDNTYTPQGISKIDSAPKNKKDSIESMLRDYLLSFRSRMYMFLGRRSRIRNFTNENRPSLFFNQENDNVIDLTSAPGNLPGKNATVWHKVEHSTYEYEETNSLSFESTGQVITSDGTCIDFDIQVNMKTELSYTREYLAEEIDVIYTDPLVINLDISSDLVSDTLWEFDLDCDGTKESINMLSKGAGFLCYDKNQDGLINNGSELFGAKTGNGFFELANYDEDNNGWIDENDSIYDKLSVWLKNSSGNDELINLKQAKIGAIYLGSQNTDYSLKSTDDFSENARIRKTGIYLSEDGLAKTISQIDMVRK